MYLRRIEDGGRDHDSDAALQLLWDRMLDRSWDPAEWFEDDDPPPQDD